MRSGYPILSTLVQAFVLAPAQIASQREMFNNLPSASPHPPPPGFMEGMGTFTIVASVASVVMGTLLMTSWPVALRLWADSVRKQILQQGPVA